MTNDAKKTNTKPESQPVINNKQQQPLTKMGRVWKMLAGLFAMAASAGVFIACVYSYARGSWRYRDMVPYAFLFFTIGLGGFFGGLASLIKLCKKPANRDTNTPAPPQEENKNCDNCKTSRDIDANSCNISAAINIEDSKDFTDNKRTNKQ